MPSLFASLCLFLSFQYACAVVLKPVVQRTDDGLLSKRATLSDLDLQSSTNLYWGASGDASANPDAVLANFTIYTPDDHENILSMEKFSGMLSAVSCSNTALQLSFKDDSDFDYAQRIWDWVNAHNNNSFVLVTGQGDCGANTDREPFRVNSIVYDTSGRTANLQGIALTWASAAHTYDLHVGHISAPGSGVSRRDYTKDWSLDFAHNFSTSKTWSKGPFSIGLDASGSGVAGEFDFELDVKTTVFVPTDVVVKLQPKGVSATAMAKLSLSGDLPDSSFGESVNVLSITLDEFQIPKILQIGPTLDIALGILAGPISGGASVTGGVTVSIPDSAIIELDLLHSSNNQFSGWTPSGEILPWEVDANVSGTVQVYAEPDLNLEASILDYGYEIGLGMKLPYVQAELDALYSSTGACPSNSLPHHIFGVKLTPEIGASLFIEASKANDLGDPLFNKTIADYSDTLTSLCLDFGPTVGTASSSTPSPTHNSTSALPTSTVGSSALPTNGTTSLPSTLSTSALPTNGTISVSSTLSTYSIPVTSAPSSPPSTPSPYPTSTNSTGPASKLRRAGFGRFGEVI